MHFPRRKTATNKHSRRHPKDPPDGGWGIVVVFAAFTVHLLTSLMTRCAGILYSSWQIEFDSSASQTGAIASIMSSCSYFGSVLAGVVCNRLGCRFTWISGGLVIFFALTMSFWVKQQIFPMYITGAFVGTGVAFCYLASNVAVAEYFKKYYAIAMGFTSAGIGTAITVFPPLIRLLLDTYGWRGTMLITAAICANICVVGALYRPLRYTARREQRLKESSSAPNDFNVDSPTKDEGMSSARRFAQDSNQIRPQERKGCTPASFLLGLFSELRLELLLKSYRFALYCLIFIEFNIAYSCTLVFLVPRAQYRGIDEQKASLLLSMMGFVSLGARVVTGFFVTRKTPVEVVFTCSIVLCGVGSLSTQFETYQSFAASACILGIGTGANRAVGTVLLRKILGLSNLASGMGLLYFLGGVGELLGPIFAGLLYDKTESFSVVFYVLAGLMFATALQMLLMPVLRRVEPGVPEEGQGEVQV